MSKAKFAAAKELIDEKQYDSARAILKTIDHPAAREWEKKLDTIAPIANYRPPEPESFIKQPPIAPVMDKRYKNLTVDEVDARRAASKPKTTVTQRGCILVLAIAIVLFIVQSRTAAPPAEAQPTIDYTQVAINSVTRAASRKQKDLTATVIALTPSATITDTPIPSATSTFTITPTPQPTAIPPTDVFGSKSNPYPLQGIGSVRDGRFRVNRVLRNQTSVVKTANQFNEDPPAGGEYVLANVTFFCDLASDKTCTVSLMDLEIVGNSGKVYKKPFSTVLDNPFQGDVFGGGETSGDVAFIVNSSDSNFEVIVNDLGSRVFFAAGA